MRGPLLEYIFKGIFLGLWLFIALNVPDSLVLGYAVGCTFGGLAVALVIAAAIKFFRGYRVGGKPMAFLLFLLLESPFLVYAGVLLGTAAGAWIVRAVTQAEDNPQMIWFVVGGIVGGIAFSVARRVESRLYRLAINLLLAALLVLGGLALFGQLSELEPRLEAIELKLVNPTLFGAVLILGIPVFYILAFTGREEESEAEIAVMCAALGLGLWVLLKDAFSLTPFRSVAFILPVAIFFIYTMKVLPGLRVFKHVLRGIGYLEVRRFRPALLSFRRALQLDPKSTWAREELWNVHRTIDVASLPNDPQLLALIDFDLCLDRAGSLLLNPGPKPAMLEEANRLLDLVVSQRPQTLPRVRYWRAVAFTHARQIDQAAAELEAVLASHDCQPTDPQRQVILLSAWQLALNLHEDLRRRVGQPVLNQPGRRMEAIIAVEKHLAEEPNDKSIWPLKQKLYQDLTEEEYDAVSGGGDLACPHFDHAYAQQLGLALINDPVRWPRGGEYLRMAARGMPTAGPSIFIQIAEAHKRADNAAGAWQNYELAKKSGQAVGPKNLSDEDRQAYFNTVKMLGDEAAANGEIDAAIENYRLYSESERSGVETLRTLADLYERNGAALNALWVTEKALLYAPRDKDLTDRKDKYYYSVMPNVLQAHIESVRNGFDVAYCIKKAKALLDVRHGDLDLVDWAQHLAELVRVMQPESVTAKFLIARCLLRRGMTSEAVEIIEAMRNPKPERFASSDDEESWNAATRLLGDLYLNELSKPDLAVACFNDYKKSPKSGADTLYKLGQAYEQIGDRAKAYRCYEQVTAYEQHPLAPQARSALYRLQDR